MMYIRRRQKVRIAGFMEESVVDGPGIRSVIFFQGCPHHCEGCQNPQTWDYEGGTNVEIRDIVERIAKNKLVSGVTFSGGEPMIQNMNRMYTLALALKQELGKNLWCYTGYRWSTLDTRYRRGTEPRNKSFKGFMRQLDVVVDGRFQLENKSLTCLYRGSTNQRLICVQASLSAKDICLWTPETTVKNYQHMVDSNYVCHKEIQARRHCKALQKGNAGNQQG